MHVSPGAVPTTPSDNLNLPSTNFTPAATEGRVLERPFPAPGAPKQLQDEPLATNYQQGMPQVACGYHMMTDVPALDTHIDPRIKLKIWQGV